MPTGLDPPPPEIGLTGRFITLMTRRRTIHRTLTIVLVIALGPLALLAAMQGVARLSRDARNANMALAEAAIETVGPDRNRLVRLQPMVELLALQGDLALRNPATCEAVREAAAAGLPSYTTLAVADASGRIGCSSAPGWVGNLLPPDGDTDGSALGLSGQALVMGPEKMRNRPGGARVAAVVSLDGLAAVMEPPQKNKGAITLIADGTGRLLAGQQPPGLPISLLHGAAGAPIAVEDASGMEWMLVSALLRPGDTPAQSIHLLFARPRIGAFGKDWWFFASSFALPLLALLLASLAIWKGASHSILRWVTELRQATGRIGEGQYRVSAERFEDAPTEVRSLVADIQRMARTISERDRTLLEALDQQRELTLELNHRVRNNLQLISSYLTLNGPTQGADVFAQVQLRVSALSLVHRLLYTHYDRTALRADILLDELQQLLSRACGIENIAVISPQIAIGVDAAVPLALGVVEAATWLQMQGVEISFLGLEAEGEEARLTVLTRSQHPLPMVETPRLLKAFARQLGGELTQLSLESARTALQIRFPAQNLDRAFEANVGNKTRR